MPTVDDVRSYWEQHPLLSYEIAAPGSPAFFDEFDRVKREDVEAFARHYWDFERFRGRAVLDVGCGPGWLTVQYAAAGATVTAVDLTARAVELCRQHLAYRGLTATVREGNAEQLPFPDDAFDLVVASGVLHHTPDVRRAIRECCRVLRPGGVGKLTFYYKGVLHSPLVFPVLRLAMRAAGVKHPGADLAKASTGVDDFIRQYDGAANPVGVGFTVGEWVDILRAAGFTVTGHELHFFPRRFIPFSAIIPRFVHRFCDRTLGTMVYFHLTK
jgi:SAM-dependent methyltransferase